SNPSKKKRTSLLHFERDRAAIYYEIRPSGDAEDAAAAAPSQPKQSREQPQQKPAGDPEADPHPVQEPAAQDSAGSDTSGPITDVSLQAVDVVHAMVAFKLKQKLSAISALKNIKTLVGGNSTLQNEVVADLQKEFGSRMPDKPEEMALQELGAAIGASDALGKCTQPLVARMFSSKMPGGFSLSSARSILETAYGLGPQRQDALLLVALTMEPASRLSSDAEATAWLDKAAQAYATRAKISYSRAAGAAASGSQAQGSMVSSTEMKKMQQQQSDFVRQQIEVLARYAGIDLRKDGHAAEAQQAATNGLQKSMDAVSAEFGDELISGVQPCFDARKARPFDSYWNWIRQDVFEWIQQAISVCIDSSDDPQPATVISEAQILRIRNCADVELLDMLAGMVTALGTSSHTFLEPARQLVHRLHKECQQALHTPPVYRELLHPVEPQTRISPRGMEYSEIPRSGEPTFAEYIEHMRCERESGEPPFVHLREKIDYHQWDYCPTLTSAYFEALSGLCSDGMSFAGKTALVTGCGRGSIGAEVIRGLLMGGAKVLATTSSYSRRTTLFFEDMYKECGSRGSELILVPFNQGSVQDIDSLVRYIFDKPSTGAAALGWNLDYVFPFAASSDIGSTSSNLGSWSELVQRIALTNVVRLLGRIKAAKKKTQRASRPSLVVMPLSPNHSTLGGDGLYGECKIGLEATFNRWEAERWEGYLSVAGAVIGWTRGTGLMSANNLIMGEMEALGMRTFSAHEMAFNILGLVYPQMAGFAHRRPVWGDFCGGMGQQNGLGELTKALVSTVEHHIEIAKQLTTDTALEYAVTQPLNYAVQMTHADIALLTKLRDYFPVPKPYESLDHLHHLQDMVNLDKVVVITGYGEVGPYGNAETRWEIESKGELSAEGCIELAWAMGLIRHANEQLPATGQHYVGWVDAKSGEPVRDDHVKAKYEEYILDHTGIRLIEPELAGGYDPDKKQILREVHIEHDMAPFEANAEEAAAYKKMNGDKVDIWENSSGGPWSVRFLKGALIRVPVSVSATRLVAGLLPTGWSFQRLGIPEELLRQIDPISVYSLIAVVEALARAGITDPYELYQYFHVSEIGNTVGSTAGGMQSAIGMFRNRRHDMEVQSDIMQETFISTVQAWTNMFLMSSAGPVKPVTGACATSLLSIDAAVETIQSGKAKMMIAGGVEDFCEESTTEFANMGASSNSVEDFVQGRTPSEMCRPCTSSRGGFVEGQGAGIVILMSASAALKCGAPIYGVVGMSATATDKQGRSAPAPGKGIMGSARETKGAPSRLLDLDYRWRKFQQQAQSLDAWKQEELDELYSEAGISESELALQVAEIDGKHGRQRRALQDTWGNEFWKENPRISPLRGSLAVWGLTADDIGLASFHGTSTKANDQNESEVLNAQLAHIGRTPGNVLPAVCQKWLVGHSKAAAAGSALNGIIQSLRTGIIPGNRNADNIDQELKSCDYSLYLSKTIQTPGIRAALVKSFGFGQVGGEALIVHSDYLLATLSREQLEEYNQKLVRAGAKAERFWQDVLVGNRPFIQIKDKPPYTPEQEQDVLLNPQARAQFDPATNEYRF
ncbi:fatty acid synthase alpha subunit Lsd1, partial [Coemansia sp. RSA 552]